MFGKVPRSVMSERLHSATEAAWHARGRGLAAYERGLFAMPQVLPWQPRSVQEALAGLARQNPGQPLRVMDFGCGAGVFLLELAYAFWQAGIPGEFTGFDRGTTEVGHLLLDFLPDNDARLQEVLDRFAPEPVTVAALPFAVPAFQRLEMDGPWDLAPESADLIVSMTAIPYLADKLFFLERVHDLLRPGGLAVLHFDELRPPFFPPDRLRRVILPDDEPFSGLLARLRADGHDIALATGPDRRHVVFLRKRTVAPLRCGLVLARTEPETWQNVAGDRAWGCRSVYGRPGEVVPETHDVQSRGGAADDEIRKAALAIWAAHQGRSGPES
jgi:SAM-dependent methyltransferase